MLTGVENTQHPIRYTYLKPKEMSKINIIIFFIQLLHSETMGYVYYFYIHISTYLSNILLTY